MKSLEYHQLKSYAEWLHENLLGARFQDVWTDGQRVVFELYQRENCYLLLDLDPQRPHLVYLPELPRIVKKPKPVSLFLQSHAKNLLLQNIFTRPESGRIIFLELGSNQKSCRLEIRLIPRSANLIVAAEGKTVAWEKPKILPASQNESVQTEIVDAAWVLQYAQIWRQAQKSVSKSPSVDPAQKMQNEIQRKQSAVLKIQQELAKHEEILYQELGDHLKYAQDPLLEIPTKLSAYYDPQQTRAANRDRAYQKAKDIVRKRQGTENRLNTLLEEIKVLQERMIQQDFTEKKTVANQILKKADSQARKKVLASGFEVVIGKSGKDNLAILRQARAWDYWLHLKDYPGAHALLFRNKNQNVPDSAIYEVAMWIIHESLGKKQATLGLKFDVIVAECRYVRPVKGANGLVTYQNQKNFTFQVKAC